MIAHEFPANVVCIGRTWTNIPFQCELSYNPADNQEAVTLTCRAEGDEDVVWLISRQALADGAESVAITGEGDVKFRQTQQPTKGVMVCLTSHEGHADLLLSYERVRAFLDETISVVPIGSENFEAAIDEALKEILG